jgi:hypothetical protein
MMGALYSIQGRSDKKRSRLGGLAYDFIPGILISDQAHH